MASRDPVRAAYDKCSRALERLSDEEQRRVIDALNTLFKLAHPSP